MDQAVGVQVDQLNWVACDRLDLTFVVKQPGEHFYKWTRLRGYRWTSWTGWPVTEWTLFVVKKPGGPFHRWARLGGYRWTSWTGQPVTEVAGGPIGLGGL